MAFLLSNELHRAFLERVTTVLYVLLLSPLPSFPFTSFSRSGNLHGQVHQPSSTILYSTSSRPFGVT
jgi:hypothetical protein